MYLRIYRRKKTKEASMMKPGSTGFVGFTSGLAERMFDEVTACDWF